MEELLISIADFFGTAVFATTGALRGISRKLDLLGVIVLSCTVGIGGGIFRDMCIGATPVASLRDSRYLIICIVVGLIVFNLPRRIRYWSSLLIIYFDAVGLGVFTSLGCAKAIQYDLPAITIILSGVITAVGGGVIRDLLVCSIPAILKQDFYATAALIGGIIFLILNKLKINFFYTFLAVSFLVTVIRIYAYRHKIQLPKAKISKNRIAAKRNS